jgi:hypothetical protein
MQNICNNKNSTTNTNKKTREKRKTYLEKT